MTRRFFVVFFLLPLIVVLAACSGLGAPAGTPTTEPTSTPTEVPSPTATPELSVFHIVSDESEVRFIAEEELLNTGFNTVFGTTRAVAGDITADYQRPAAAQIGVIRIDLSTLKTDNPVRNQSITQIIVPTYLDKFQYAEFVTTRITGLPDAIVLNEPFTFQIIGNMTIHGITKPLTFTATVTPISETRLEGTAAGELIHTDYEMTIPKAAVLLGVNEIVKLEIDFVAEIN